MATLNVDGVKLHYDVAGDGPPLVLVHGMACGRRMWWHQVRHFRKRFRVVTLDLRGHGLSDAPADPAQYSEAIFTSDVIRLLDALGIDRAHLVGLSMGGGVALDAALKVPERFASVVLADIGSNSDAPGISRLKAEQWSDMILSAGMDWFVDEMLRHSFFKYYARQGKRQRRHMAALIRQHSPVGLSRVLSHVLAPRKPLYRRGFALSGLAVPALVLVGRFDYSCRKPSKFVVARAPRAQLAELRTGHLTALEDPAGFNRAVEAFIDQVGAATAR